MKLDLKKRTFTPRAHAEVSELAHKSEEVSVVVRWYESLRPDSNMMMSVVVEVELPSGESASADELLFFNGEPTPEFVHGAILGCFNALLADAATVQSVIGSIEL